MVKHLKITVEGKIYDVVVEDVTEDAGSTLLPDAEHWRRGAAASPAARLGAARQHRQPLPVAGGDDKVAPLGGVIIEVAVKVGDAVKTGDKVVVIEAMKMKTVVSAHKDGKVDNVAVKVGRRGRRRPAAAVDQLTLGKPRRTATCPRFEVLQLFQGLATLVASEPKILIRPDLPDPARRSC